MEKSRAIEVLKPLVNSFVDYANITMKEEDDDIVEALEMAVESLKAQHSSEGTTKDATSDLISRQAAIDAIVQCTNCGDEDTLREYVLKHSLDNGWTGGILEALDAVKDLPPAQPEPHEGEWEQVSAQRYFMSASYFYRCSVCGENNPRNTNYCPNCGADMRGKKNE